MHAELSDLPGTIASIEAAMHIHALDSSVEDVLRRMLSLADVAVAIAADTSTSAAGDVAATAPAPDNGWLSPLVDGLEYVLRNIKTGLDKYNVPYSDGWSIVALTAFVKLLTLPLTKQQVESQLAVQALKPKIDAIKESYGDNKDAISRETSALYEKAGVNPLAGCLPSIATIPIFIGLYRSLTSVAATGELDNQGFYWIPSLAGPTSIAAQKAGTGTAWLFPLLDGAPPIGWEDASKYLVLPIALVIAQWISSAIISPPVDPNAENAKLQKGIFLALPLMIGWFALNVPSGLSLYYFSNTVFTSAQQIFLRKLGGAKQAEFDLGPINLGQARRTGTLASDDDINTLGANASMSGNGSVDGVIEAAAAPAVAFTDESRVVEEAGAVAPVVPVINKRCKRKRRDLMVEA
jgi:YidC/Oxa1 family membrane protein insertase